MGRMIADNSEKQKKAAAKKIQKAEKKAAKVKRQKEGKEKAKGKNTVAFFRKIGFRLSVSFLGSDYLYHYIGCGFL